jgi:hypothetical protein
LRQQLGWRVTKRVIARAAWVMVMAMKRAMATNGNNMGNGYGKEGNGRLTAAMRVTAQRTWPLVLQLERGG